MEGIIKICRWHLYIYIACVYQTLSSKEMFIQNTEATFSLTKNSLIQAKCCGNVVIKPPDCTMMWAMFTVVS